MRRVLKGITMASYETLTDALTSRWAKEVYESDGESGLYDVIISENVIMKSYSTHVNFDLAGKLAALENCEFVSIEII